MDLDLQTVIRWLIIGVVALLGLSLLGVLGRCPRWLFCRSLPTLGAPWLLCSRTRCPTHCGHN
ncbi:MAG: hypothetical protein BRD54_04110 [Bacteroidetes bacterium SW_8_64_56]|nr:MAG: hypothetical protein BRD54_04110 [Bacteroidetes bacterium SW_8_64_56]